MTTHSSILAWRIPRTEEPGGLQSMGSHKESDTTERLTTQHKECLGCVTFSAKVGTVQENWDNWLPFDSAQSCI